MKQLILLLLPVLAVLSATAQDIEWKDGHRLSWSDFKDRPSMTSSYHALTNSGIAFETTYKDGVMDISVLCQFDPSKSWVKPDKETPELLQHEQLHFDITELYARKLRKALAEKSWNIEMLEKDLNKTFDYWLKKQDEAQDAYDRETDHSKNDEAQQKWNERIAKELEELKDYSDSSIQIELK